MTSLPPSICQGTFVTHKKIASNIPPAGCPPMLSTMMTPDSRTAPSKGHVPRTFVRGRGATKRTATLTRPQSHSKVDLFLGALRKSDRDLVKLPFESFVGHRLSNISPSPSIYHTATTDNELSLPRMADIVWIPCRISKSIVLLTSHSLLHVFFPYTTVICDTHCIYGGHCDLCLCSWGQCGRRAVPRSRTTNMASAG